GDERINLAVLFEGDHARKYSRILGRLENTISRDMSAIDVSFLKRITMDRLRQLVNEALAAGDVVSAQSYISTFNSQGGNA
ncbi:MAG: hypothetical protein Q4D71_14650, partial [Oscillospiraceae bacterium]|nr:hypothetical protein [Oscillospiraceae bacterium]